MKSFSIACLMICGLLFPNIRADAQNILTDGSFTNTASITPYYTGPEPLNIWSSWWDAYTNVVTEITADGVCKYIVNNGGSESWYVQLNQWGFALEQNFTYRLSFDVKADAPRSFGVFIGESGGSWTNLNPNRTQQATTEWQTKTIVFDAYQIFPLHKLSFEMGGANGVMLFDNIVLEKTGPSVFANIDMIGTSAPPYDWSMGVNMQTTDGIHYTLANYTLAVGELKFRQDQNWGTNWGANTFPSGYGTQNGPNIPVQPGIYNISFNRLTGQYFFDCVQCVPTIGIIGSAVPPNYWNSDVFMLSSDGITYTLNNYDLTYGELRFRQNGNWNMNWGGTTFPNGVGDMYSSSIQVAAGNYSISFNRLTGAYQFVLNIPQIGILGSALNGWNDDIDMQTTDGINYNLMNQVFTAGEVKFRQDNNWNVNWGDINFPWGNAYRNGPNIPIPAGTYDVYFNRTYGNYYFSRVCQPPVISKASTSITSLWPANHKMVDVQVYYNLSDACPIVDSSISVTSNEPENGLGDGDTAPDWKVINHHLVQLRAERSGNGKGRIYTITIQATDVLGNVVSKTLDVLVPHNVSAKKAIIPLPTGALTATVTPNPSAQYFNVQIKSNSSEKVMISVLDMSGRMVSNMITEKNQSVRLGNDLKPGIYIIEVVQGAQKTMTRVVKQ